MNESATNHEDESDLYPIRTVASLTGVNPVTLRAWERRYGLIEPARTNGRHRLYSAADIERIQRALELIDQGIPVSKVREALERAPTAQTATQPPWQDFRLQMLRAVGALDQSALERVYNDAVATHPIPEVMRRIVLPVLEALGARWERDVTGGVAEEHFFALFLRNKLGARFHHAPSADRGARIICCCLPGEHHEIGLLMFALEAQNRGFRPILLGADMPLGELDTAVSRTGAKAIVLSSSIMDIYQAQRVAISELVALTSVPVFLGGPVAARSPEEVTASGAIAIGADIASAFRTIERRLAHAHGSA